jgi:hypothetical protein
MLANVELSVYRSSVRLFKVTYMLNHRLRIRKSYCSLVLYLKY